MALQDNHKYKFKCTNCNKTFIRQLDSYKSGDDIRCSCGSKAKLVENKSKQVNGNDDSRLDKGGPLRSR